MNLKLKPRAFPIGTKVKAYARSNWAQKDLPVSGAPKGAAVAEAEVASDGTLEFAGLEAKTNYLAHAEVGEEHRYVAFRTAAASEGNVAAQDVAEEQARAEAAEAAKLAKAENLKDVADAATARTNLGLGTAAMKASTDFDAAGAAAAAQAASQPLDADLTAIAALATSAFGRELLTKASAQAVREALGLPTTNYAALAAAVGPIKEKTELQEIPGLTVAIGASATEIWQITYWLLVESANAAMDLKMGLTVPAGATGRWGGMRYWNDVTIANEPGGPKTLAEEITFGTAAGTIAIALRAIVIGGGTGGNVVPKYAQNTKDAGNLAIAKGSLVQAVKMAS